jgi:hypothetical protein
VAPDALGALADEYQGKPYQLMPASTCPRHGVGLRGLTLAAKHDRRLRAHIARGSWLMGVFHLSRISSISLQRRARNATPCLSTRRCRG